MPRRVHFVFEFRTIKGCLKLAGVGPLNQVFRRQFVNWWLSNVASMFGTLLFLSQMLDMPMMRREMKDGLYRPVSFILAQGLLEMPFLISVVACAPAFAIGGWPFDSLWEVSRFLCLWHLRRLGQVAFHRSTQCWVNAIYGCLVHSALVHGLQ